MIEVIGWVGAICFSICAIPQAIKSWQTKSAKDLSSAFLILWVLGEILTLIYVLPKGHLPLIFNYVFNLLALVVICFFKWRKP